MISPLEEPVIRSQPIGAKQQEVTLETHIHTRGKREGEGWHNIIQLLSINGIIIHCTCIYAAEEAWHWPKCILCIG